MKTKLLKLLLLSLPFLTYNANAQWTNTGPEGGMILSLAQNGSTLMALTPGGLYSSTDNGSTWSASRNGVPFVEIKSLIAANGKFIAGSGNGIYSSTDGQTWSNVGQTVKLLGSRANHVFGTAYIGTSRIIYRSADGGTTWASTSVSFDIANGFAVIDTILFIGAQNGVMYSINNGTSWTGLNINVGGSGIGAVSDIQPAIGGGLLIAAGGKVYKHNGSVLSTSATEATGIPPVVSAVKIGVLNNKYLLSVGDKSGISQFEVFMKSADGLTWTPDSQSFIGKIFAFKTYGSNSFICAAKGLYKSTNNGASWGLSVTGMKAQSIADVTADNNKVYAGVSNSTFKSGYFFHAGGSLHMSSDNGATWQALNFPDTLAVKKVFASGNNLLVAANYTGMGNGVNTVIMRSTDGGTTWSMVTNNTALIYNNNLFYAAGAHYITSATAIDKSTDFGATWTSSTAAGFPLTASVGLTSVGTTLIANTSQYINFNGGIYKTANGTDWTQSNNGFDNNMVVSKAVGIGNSVFAIQQNATSGIGTSIHRSDNAGALWANKVGNLPVHYFSDVYGWSGNVYLSTGYSLNGQSIQLNGIDSGSVWGSTDNGNTWTDMSAGLPSISFGNMAVANSKLYVATNGYSLWSKAVTPNGTTGVSSAKSITQNITAYPNPSKGLLHFEGIDKGDLRITDVAGKEVLNTTFSNSSIDMSVLHGGVYFFTIQEGDTISKGKFIIE